MRKLVVVLVGLAAVALVWGGALLAPVDRSNPRRVDFFIAPGQTLRGVSVDLRETGLIRSPRAFVALARLRRRARRIQAGPYEAGTGEWAWEILERITSGEVRDTTVTIPEGLWLTEVSEILAPLVAGGADSFLAVARDTTFVRRLGIPGPSLEGYLFPSTYRVLPGGAPQLVARQMVETFDRIWREGLAARAESLGLDRHGVVTLASIVEAEAGVAAERPRIAAVYRNRLARGMALQADPTVAYALGERKKRILYDDLESSSPYNTYRFAGLPPGPIGNPGLGSLRAVLWPEPGCLDLYFVARGDGTHLFGRTFAEHQRNRRRARRERARVASGQ